MVPQVSNVEEVASTIEKESLEAQKLLQLASAQRMNTDVRRAIFCVIMSGEDYIDAFEKLLRLNLHGKQVSIFYFILFFPFIFKWIVVCLLFVVLLSSLLFLSPSFYLQDREIMRVLVECCLQEQVYNKYYSVLATRLCSHDNNHKATLKVLLFLNLDLCCPIGSIHMEKKHNTTKCARDDVCLVLKSPPQPLRLCFGPSPLELLGTLPLQVGFKE